MNFHEPKFTTIPFVDRMIETGERYLRQRGFMRVTAPRIVPASGACENIDTLFEIGVGGNSRWFNSDQRKAYFAQTGQLYLESLLGKGGLKKVYCVGPSGRAEPDVDSRHLTEFEMIEIESRSSFEQLLHEIELFITGLVESALSIPVGERRLYGLPEDISHLERHLALFPRIEYCDAIAELGLTWGSDISSRLEQQLIKNHGRGPILITHFPNPESERMQRLFERNEDKLAIKFFNMQPDPEDSDYVLSADCIVPYGGECVGAAARVWQFEEFRSRLFNSLMFKNLKEKDPKAEEGFAWYLGMLEQFPSVPHAGCGFGMSRIFQYILAKTNITEVVTFPVNRACFY